MVVQNTQEMQNENIAWTGQNESPKGYSQLVKITSHRIDIDPIFDA